MNRSGSFFLFLTIELILGLALRLIPPGPGLDWLRLLPSIIFVLGGLGSSRKSAESSPGETFGVDGTSTDGMGVSCFRDTFNGESNGGRLEVLLVGRGFPDFRARRRASLS
jgi:hypothetical protein